MKKRAWLLPAINMRWTIQPIGLEGSRAGRPAGMDNQQRHPGWVQPDQPTGRLDNREPVEIICQWGLD